MPAGPNPQLSSVVKEDVSNIMAKCRTKIDSLNGSTVLITGSTGFLARELTESLLWSNKSGHRIKLVLTSREPRKVAEVFGDRLGPEVDVIFTEEMDQYPARIDYIVHAASPCDPRINNASPSTTIVDIVNLAQKAIMLGLRNKVKNFLLISSGAVYGVQPPDLRRIPEGYTGAPDISQRDSGYGEAKRCSELMVRSSGLPFTILRGFSFIGPNQDLNSSFAVPEFISSGLGENRIVIVGDGRPVRSFCYESDLTVMLLKTLAYAEDQTLNAGNDRPELSIKDLADIIAGRIGGVEIEVKGTVTPGPPPRYVPNIDRMSRIYAPTVNVVTGIERVIRHVLETRPGH